MSDHTPIPLNIETWRDFEERADHQIPTIIDRLWPEAAFAFIAAPPKKGKTWVALSLAISVATGQAFLDHFQVPEPQPVLFVALEGHRAGIRDRVGALARGLGLDPDSGDLDNLHWLYKPEGMNLAEKAWADVLHSAAQQTHAALVIVDVLRASARLKENDQEAFGALKFNLQPITNAGHSVAMNHHFAKLTETQKERAPGERMSGSGAMFGALDVAIYITGSENGARRLRLEFDTRDIAAPDTISVSLDGEGTGENNGFTYQDTATWRLTSEVNADDLKAPPPDVVAWLEQQPGRTCTTAELSYAFDCGANTILRRTAAYQKAGIVVTLKGRGKATTYSLPTSPLQTSPRGEVDDGEVKPALTLDFCAPLQSTPNGHGDPSKTLDLQGKTQPRHLAIPTGYPTRGEVVSEAPFADPEKEPTPTLDDEPEPFPEPINHDALWPAHATHHPDRRSPR